MMMRTAPFNSAIAPQFIAPQAYQYFPAETFPETRPIHWLHSHFAVGGWSPLQRLSGMLTAHMTTIAPHNGFTWHPHRGLEIYTWVLDGTIYHEDTTGGQGEIGAGELQRMFSGHWIQHQELNPFDEPTRVIQIWYAADPAYRDLEPHYQQAGRSELPQRKLGDGTVFELIGENSPMQQHMDGRLTATVIPAGGRSEIEAPRVGEDLFLYVVDGAGSATLEGKTDQLSLYDVILATPEMPDVILQASDEKPMQVMSFYLPEFIYHNGVVE